MESEWSVDVVTVYIECICVIRMSSNTWVEVECSSVDTWSDFMVCVDIVNQAVESVTCCRAKTILICHCVGQVGDDFVSASCVGCSMPDDFISD